MRNAILLAALCSVVGCSDATAEGPVDAGEVDVSVDASPGVCSTDEECPEVPCFTRSCKSGECVQKERVCEDNDQCTDDKCDADPDSPKYGNCLHTNNTADCDDNDKCTLTSTCNGKGACIGSDLKTCDDENPCTDDSCDPQKDCVFKNNNKNTCSDGDGCSLEDQCQSGKCVSFKSKHCDDATTCTTDKCDSATGNCVYTPKPKDCNDDNPCTTDKCDNEVAKDCVHVKIKGCCTADSQCDDGNKCTTGEVCKKDNTCQAGVNTCECNKDKDCQDNDACTNDVCNDSGKCENKQKKDCDDGYDCTVDGCDANTGLCAHQEKDILCKDKKLPCFLTMKCNKAKGCVGDKPLLCSDGNACTNDKCINGKCEFSSANPCDDNNVCTNDVCDTKTGKCAHKPNTNSCTDDNACTLKDICSKGFCVGEPIDCKDGKACTVDDCNKKSGKCFYTTKVCNDGDNCTKDECVDGKCKYKPSQCLSNNVCVKGTCNPATGACAWATLDGKVCDDGNACLTNDVCKKEVCVGTKPVVCDDGVWCSLDSCDSKQGCVHKMSKNCCGKDADCPVNKDPTGSVEWCDKKHNQCLGAIKCKSDDDCGGGGGGGICYKDGVSTLSAGSNGKCLPSGHCHKEISVSLCDDKNKCTKDSCDKKQDTCVYTPIPNCK